MENPRLEQLENQMTNLMDLLKIPEEKRNFEGFWDQIKIVNAVYLSKNDNTLEKILNSPGLQHIAENIFNNVKYEDLEICRGINQSSKVILDKQINKPMFLLKKFRSISEKNQKEWIKAIEAVKNSEKEKAIISYLQWNLKRGDSVDLPCYTSSAVQDDFRKKIL